jgi:D-alanyl-D-alanine carboxypeptidase (penicillin-binding protein 5/6)
VRKRLLALFLIIGAVLLVLPRVELDNPEDIAPGAEVAVSRSADLQSFVPLEAAGAIVIDQATGDLLYEKNARQQLYPASTTKILTALLAIEQGELDSLITVGEEIFLVSDDSSRAGLRIGEQLMMRDLIRALMLPSGNDAAYTIAVQIAREKSGDKSLDNKQAVALFAELMNSRAQQAGAKNSHFVNPDGYHDQRHYTTPWDMALIAREAMQEPFFQETVGMKYYESRGWKNTNQLLDPASPYYYSCATGVKTGYTSAAGHCLVSSASRDGAEVIAVVLKSSETGQWTDSVSLLEKGFDRLQELEAEKAAKEREQREKRERLKRIFVSLTVFVAALLFTGRILVLRRRRKIRRGRRRS